jgi:hypothetical protein
MAMEASAATERAGCLIPAPQAPQSPPIGPTTLRSSPDAYAMQAVTMIGVAEQCHQAVRTCVIGQPKADSRGSDQEVSS